MIAAVYARKSTSQSAVDEEQKSVARQVANARAFAAERGWTVDDAHIYIDDGVSGAEARRLVAKQRLLDLALGSRCPFQVVIMQAQDRFSRASGDIAFSELKSLAQRVPVWFYSDGTQFTHGTLATNVVGMLGAEFAAEFRRAIAAKTFEAMKRRAEQGHVTGGVLFGYDNVRVNSHVERRVNAAEAVVVREIFKRGAAGEGLRAIAKALNAAGAVAPRARQGRARSWSPSSVRDVLLRSTYAGVVTWNKSKKRDAEGQQRQHDRPSTDWLTVPAEHLRIVSEPLWRAVQARLRDKRASAIAAPPAIVGRGIRQRYFLAGFGKCVECGGSMMVVSRASSGGRKARYVCSTYWNRGTTVCSNGMMTELPTTDTAVRALLKGEVLRPRAVKHAIELAVETLQKGTKDGSHVARLQTQLASLDRELRNLAETAARGGAVPAVLALLGQREEQRRSVNADLVLAQRTRACPIPNATAMRARLDGFLDDWEDLLGGADTVKARTVLDRVLADRIRFTPDADQHQYHLTVPVHYTGILEAVVPEFAGFTRNDGVPKGIRHSLPAGFPRNVAI